MTRTTGWATERTTRSISFRRGGNRKTRGANIGCASGNSLASGPTRERWLRPPPCALHEQVDTARRADPELDALLHAFPEQAVYLDLETCGFAGSMVFLIGLIHQQAGRLVLSQLLARNYAEEKPMLQTLWTIAAGKRVLATFNGKSFDWPMVHDRSTVHHLGHDARTGRG